MWAGIIVKEALVATDANSNFNVNIDDNLDEHAIVIGNQLICIVRREIPLMYDTPFTSPILKLKSQIKNIKEL